MRKFYLLFILLFAFTQVAFGQISNGDFESWTAGVPDGWTIIDAGITVTEENTIKHGGSASASVSVTESSQDNTDLRQTIGVVGNTRYRFSVFVYHTVGEIEARLYVNGYKEYSDQSIIGSWQQLSYEFNTPSTGQIEIGLRFYTNQGGSLPEVVYVDDFTSSVLSPDLVINEIHADPDATEGDANGDGTVSTTQDEFVEIINTTTSSIDMANFTLSDAVGIKHVFLDPTIIAAGESIVIFGGGTPTGIPGTSTTASSGGLGLNNTGDVVTLADGSAVDIDSYTYGSEANDNQSIGRNPDINGNFEKHSLFAPSSTLFSPGKRNDDGTPLPVELTSFTASALATGVMLNWSTATEVNNYGFDVEKKAAGNWEKIGFVEGHGNSNSPNDYSFVDKAATVGEVSYRLKQVDTDGAFEYSDVVTVASVNLAKNELNQNHPNPFNPSTAISFSLAELAHVNITVYNAIGQKVMELANEQMDAGFHKVNFDGSNLSSGFYFYRLETPNYSKTMKMILLR